MYEPVVVDYLSIVIALAIGAFIAVCVLWGAINPESVEPFKIPDKFELGYIEDNNPLAETYQLAEEYEYDELKDLERQVKIKKLKQQLKEMDEPKAQTKPKKTKPKKTKPTQQVNPIIKDCIDAMIAMGEKKSVARSTVNKYFVNNPNTKSVEDFISGVFKK